MILCKSPAVSTNQPKTNVCGVDGWCSTIHTFKSFQQVLRCSTPKDFVQPRHFFTSVAKRVKHFDGVVPTRTMSRSVTYSGSGSPLECSAMLSHNKEQLDSRKISVNGKPLHSFIYHTTTLQQNVLSWQIWHQLCKLSHIIYDNTTSKKLKMQSYIIQSKGRKW